MADVPILTPKQDAVLRALGKSALAKRVYWTGGTLLAARFFRHRRSLDLDLFSEELLDADFVDAAMRAVVRAAGGRNVRLTRFPSRTQYFLQFPGGELRVDTVYFPFPALGRRTRWPAYQLTTDSVRDIAANKAHAITERNEPKDVFDLYTILQKEKRWTLGRVFTDVEKKFGAALDPVHFGARALAGIAALDRLAPLLPTRAPTADAIRTFFSQEARRDLRRRLRRET